MIHAKKHFTVSIWVFDEKKRVLLIMHPKFKKWLQPGGHLEENELPTEGAMRELLEEVGLDASLPHEYLDDVLILKSPDYLQVHDVGDHNHMDMSYVLRVKNFEPRLGNDGITDACWVSEDELDSMDLFDNTKTMIRRIISEKL